MKTNLKYLILILLISTSLQKNLKVKKGIFDETKIKNMKLKNRIIRGSVGDNSFCNGKISEEGFKLYEDLSKGEVGTYSQDMQQ